MPVPMRGIADFRTRATASPILNRLPLDSANGFTSAKSQVIGSACRRNVLTTSSFFGELLQVQRDEFDSASFSTTNAKYTTTASAYAAAPAPPDSRLVR